MLVKRCLKRNLAEKIGKDKRELKKNYKKLKYNS